MIKRILHNKKRLAAIIIFVLFIAVWLAQVIYVNVTARKTVYKYYDIGEECYYKGCNIKVLGYEYMSDEEFLEKYNFSWSDLNYANSDIRKSVYIVELKLTKMIECNEDSDVYMTYDLGPGTDIKAVSVADKCFNCPPTFTKLLETNYVEEYKELEVGESIIKKFPFTFTDTHLVDFYRDNFDSYPLYIELADYEEQQYICRMKVNETE